MYLHKPGILNKINKKIVHYGNEIYVKDTVNYLKNKFNNIKICLVGFSMGGTFICKAQQKLNYDACVLIDFPISVINSLRKVKYKGIMRFDKFLAKSIYGCLKKKYTISRS